MSEVITITDGKTLNPGDLSWSSIEAFGTLRYHDRTSPSELVARCRDATIIVTNKTPVRATDMAACPKLKLIAVTATGFNIVDIDAAKSRGIIVCNVPGYGTDSVAQHTFALILELANNVGENSRSVASGEWSRSLDFCYTKGSIVELAGKTLGIVGYGMIGQKVAEIGRAFGMRVIYARGNSSKDPQAISVKEVFAQSDVVSLHCPLTKENREFVNAALLKTMQPNAVLINTARGQLIHESDLALALKENVISGAGLDVLSQEPPPADNPLVGLPNCLITPHNAWCSFEARQRIMKTTVENIRRALDGIPQNVVSS